MLMLLHGASKEYKGMIYINRWHEYKNAHLKHKIHQKTISLNNSKMEGDSQSLTPEKQ